MGTVLDVFNCLRFAVGLAGAEWVCLRFHPLKEHWRRTALAGGIAISVLSFAQLGLMPLCERGPLSMVGYAIVFSVYASVVSLCSLPVFRAMFDVTWTNLMVGALTGMCCERIITTLWKTVMLTMLFPSFMQEHPISYMLLTVLLYAAVFLLIARFTRPDRGLRFAPPAVSGIPLCLLYACCYVLLTMLSNVCQYIIDVSIRSIPADAGIADPSLRAIVIWFCTVMQLLFPLVLLLLGASQSHMSRLRHEALLLSNAMSRKAEQYRSSAASIEAINRKCHDLRHQLAALRFAGDDERNRLIEETRRAIDIYDSTFDTGNPALDTLLTERSFHCANLDIRLSCTIGARTLGTIGVVDLYTMVGNALDNSIEAAVKLDDPDSRTVTLSIVQRGSLVVIAISNYFSGTLSIGGDGLPATTKADVSSHGIGIASIRSIARRYGGDVTVDAVDGTFTLRISLFTKD